MITREKADEIARNYAATAFPEGELSPVLTIAEIRHMHAQEPKCYSDKPLPAPEECWFAFLHRHRIGSTTVILLSMEDGQILCVGSTGE